MAADNSPAPRMHGVRRTNFVSLSTHVKIALKPFPHVGKLVTKSMDQDSKRLEGMGRGASRPGAASVLSLER